MLGKLFKYENKSVSKLLTPMALAVIILPVLGALILKMQYIFGDKFEDGSIVSSIFSLASGIMIFFIVIATISACFISLFILMQRYYKNLFSDEGYLTFTLPVKTGSIILSKLFTAVIWSVIITICTIIGVITFAFFGTSASFVNHEVIDGFCKAFKQIFEFYFTGSAVQIIFLIELLISIIVSLFTNILLMYLAITIGCQIAKKHKVLASIGMYFVISSVVSVLSTIIQVITTTTLYGGFDFIYVEPALSDVTLILLPSIIFSIILGVCYFLLNNYILKNKLNIE